MLLIYFVLFILITTLISDFFFWLFQSRLLIQSQAAILDLWSLSIVKYPHQCCWKQVPPPLSFPNPPDLSAHVQGFQWRGQAPLLFHSSFPSPLVSAPLGWGWERRQETEEGLLGFLAPSWRSFLGHWLALASLVLKNPMGSLLGYKVFKGLYLHCIDFLTRGHL